MIEKKNFKPWTFRTSKKVFTLWSHGKLCALIKGFSKQNETYRKDLWMHTGMFPEVFQEQMVAIYVVQKSSFLRCFEESERFCLILFPLLLSSSLDLCSFCISVQETCFVCVAFASYFKLAHNKISYLVCVKLQNCNNCPQRINFWPLCLRKKGDHLPCPEEVWFALITPTVIGSVRTRWQESETCNFQWDTRQLNHSCSVCTWIGGCKETANAVKGKLQIISSCWKRCRRWNYSCSARTI